VPKVFSSQIEHAIYLVRNSLAGTYVVPFVDVDEDLLSVVLPPSTTPVDVSILKQRELVVSKSREKDTYGQVVIELPKHEPTLRDVFTRKELEKMMVVVNQCAMIDPDNWALIRERLTYLLYRAINQ
jgi:hypothetical protein